jgi:hypothetical protein
MEIKRISIKKINIQNFKNIENGNIVTFDFTNIKKNHNFKENHVLAIYGQNGTGKTALIETLELLKIILTGESIPKNMFENINILHNIAYFTYTFFIETNQEILLLTFTFSLDKKKQIIFNEELKVKLYQEQWLKTKKILTVNKNNEKILLPQKLNNQIKNYSKDSYLNLTIQKRKTEKESLSFLFYQESYNILNKIFQNSLISHAITYLKYFGQHNLIILTNIHQEFNHLNLIYYNQKEGNKITLKLLDSNLLSKNDFKLIEIIINQINLVLSTLIPNLQLKIFIHNQENNDNQTKIYFDILSVKENYQIPLNQESAGIKKIISILNTIILMFNNPLITLAIDELDAGIFEYLLGELLSIIEESAKGQLIFTSHNLRALERLKKESIIFTTSNPQQRFTYLNKTRSNHNLREQYLRAIILKGQKENLYQETNNYQIKHALKIAGINYE